MGRYEMVFAIVFVVMFAAMFKHWLEYRQNRDTRAGDSGSEERLNRLEERIVVLERIVTDRGYELRQELPKLED